MTGPIWLLIGAAGGAAATGAYLFARAIHTWLLHAYEDLDARIEDLLDEEPEPFVEDDVWDRDLRHLLTDSID